MSKIAPDVECIAVKDYTYPSNVPTERRGRPVNNLLPTKRLDGTSAQQSSKFYFYLFVPEQCLIYDNLICTHCNAIIFIK
jgi:hypothetical protein